MKLKSKYQYLYTEESKSAVLEALSVIAKSSTSAHPYSTVSENSQISTGSDL